MSSALVLAVLASSQSLPRGRPAVGTYAINDDCTGTAQIVPSDGGPAVNLRLVVVNRGREVRTTVVGNATGSVGIKVD